METTPRLRSRARWIVLAWLATMTSGALSASVLRLPTGIPVRPSLMFLAHAVVAVAIGSAVIGHLVRASAAPRVLPALFVAATFLCGLLTFRTFAPLTSAAHAALAAYAALVLAGTGSSDPIVPSGAAVRSWRASMASAGVLLLTVQIALGSLLRHHLIGYGWHLLVAGIAALSVLVPAVGSGQDADTSPVQKRAAVLAISSLLVQVSLGVLLLFMMLTGSANVRAWLFTSVAHVVAATVTLLAAARFAALLRMRPGKETVAPFPTAR